jgi:hypothetical protein
MSRKAAPKLSRVNRSEPPADHEMVEAMAYLLWLKRGCPIGTDQEDWYRAEAELTSANRANPHAA